MKDISIEKDVIETWKNFKTNQKEIFSDFLSLYKFRHWIAHGRYWTPKLGNINNHYDPTLSLDDPTLSLAIANKIFKYLDSFK